MLRVLWQLTRGYRMSPWRSPYLRWRMETYWGLHADQIGFADFWLFVWQRRADLWRYLRWAGRRGALRLERRSAYARAVLADGTSSAASHG
jgi:hypothetical protein